MRLSEAICLGRMMIKPKAGTFGDSESGCAFGMALTALGKNSGDSTERGHFLLRRYGWLLAPAKLPCDCPREWFAIGLGNGAAAAGIIAHLFDYHVSALSCAARGKSWTFEQMLDWIREQEPTEEIENVEETKCEEFQLVKQ